MNSKQWAVRFLAVLTVALAAVIGLVVYLDPFFHYHAPNPDYFYPLNNQRSQNDGIIRHFDYDGIITGNSMTENFKTSEAEALFGGTFIKVPFSGASFKEINDNLAAALRRNPEIKTVIRCLDYYGFYKDKDDLRLDLGSYPFYLYDDNIFNDVSYVLNKDIIFDRCLPMLTDRRAGTAPGVTAFDRYSYWSESYSYGKHAVIAKRLEENLPYTSAETITPLTQQEKQSIRENAEQNIVALARQYPDTQFYYFFPPFSAAYYGSLVQDGILDREIEAERLYIEAALECSNIHLYSFSNLFDVTTDLNHYKDNAHYGAWINSDMLRYMQEGTCLLTAENYQDYLAEKLSFYHSYDYNQLLEQEDLEDNPNGPGR